MAQTTADEILANLQLVEKLRLLHQGDPALGAKLQALKHYQQRRFANTYADLLVTPRYQHATQFFLQELYGPGDFSRRDAQFARVVPALVKLFPTDVVHTVGKLAQLHAMSEQLDTKMAQLLCQEDAITALAYRRAWQACAQAPLRQAQIELTLAVGESLERLTRKPLLRQALRMMRGPATAAGLPELQKFLELGFDTFREMRGAAEFLQTIRLREEALARALFTASSADAERPRDLACLPSDDALGQLP